MKEKKTNGSIKISLQKLEVKPKKNKILMSFYLIRIFFMSISCSSVNAITSNAKNVRTKAFDYDY